MSSVPIMVELSPETAPAEPEQERYPSEEAQEILQIAIARHTDQDELTRSQLLEIAEELGISANDLSAAEAEWQIRKQRQADLQAFEQYRRQRFQSHLIRYGIVNLFLMAINYLAADQLGWSLYIALFWGVGLVLQAWQTYQPNPYRYNQEFEKWRRRQQLKRSFSRFLDWLLGT